MTTETLEQPPAAAHTITLPTLGPGELYAGLVLRQDGTPSHHLVLLPARGKALSWDQAIEWAAAVGGALPTRQEQALLYANIKQHFEPRWYWSSEEYEGDGSHAWLQTFDYGHQFSSYKSYEARAAAVRLIQLSA